MKNRSIFKILKNNKLPDIFTDYFSDYECNRPLMEYAVLTATSSLRDRGPEKARLNGMYNLNKSELFWCDCFVEFL